MNTQMVIRDMNPKDLDQVFEIEKALFLLRGKRIFSS